MAVVNKFNVNKQEVTLDADIIENMSANDVSYDDSTQYDENTVGEKLNKLSELEDEIYDESIFPNLSIDEFSSLSKFSYQNNWVAPEDNIRSLTSIIYSANTGQYKPTSLEIGKHKNGEDVIVLKTITEGLTGGVQRIDFNEPITCEEDYHLVARIPNDSSSKWLKCQNGHGYYIVGNVLSKLEDVSASFADKVVGFIFIDKKSNFDGLNKKIDSLKNETSEEIDGLTKNISDLTEEISSAKEELVKDYVYPNIPKDEFYNLTRKDYIAGFYFTPERNVRRLTGISFMIRSNWIPTESIKIVAYKPNDVIILKEIIATGGINEITFEEPITCDDEHEIAVYLTSKPGDSSWYLYNYTGGVWYRAEGTTDFQPQSNYSSLWSNTLIGGQFYNNISISEEVDELKDELKKESSYYVKNTEFEKVKSLAESKADDFFANKMVVFSGDSWSQGTYESRSKVYRTVFAALHPSCIVEDKTCFSGSTIADRGAGLGSISTRVKGRIEQYGDKFFNSYYPLTTSDNISTATPGGRIILDVDRLDYLRFKFDPLGVLNNSIRIYFYSYNQSNSKYTELTNVWQYVEGITDENAAIVTIMLASQIKALDGETLAIKLKYNSYSWTDTNVKVVNDESKQYNIEGVITAGSPLLTYGYKGDMDYLIIEGGLNDCYGSYPLGVLSEGYDATYDRTTFYGALEDMFSDIVKKSPSTKTGFIIMPMADTPNWGTYVEAIKAACDKWGIIYLDLDGLMRERLVGMGLNSDSIYWSIYPDGNTNPHPSAYGYEMMNSKIFSWMNTL